MSSEKPPELYLFFGLNASELGKFVGFKKSFLRGYITLFVS